MNETIGCVLIGIGLLFDLLGCIALARLPDIYNRLQAGTKCVTLGTCMILMGVLVYSGIGALGVKALIRMVFLLLTSPVAAHAIARGAYRSGVPLWPGSVIDRYGEKFPQRQTPGEDSPDA